MKRTLITIALALVAGCATGMETKQPVHQRVGSGSFNDLFRETVSLSTGTVFSAAHFVGSSDTVAIGFRVATGTAVCSEVIEYSNEYSPSVDSPTDDTKWDTYTSPSFSSPPAIAGGAQKFLVELNMFSPSYERVKFTCSSGTTSLTLVTQVKGG